LTDAWTKVHFDLDPTEWHETPGEFLWAKPVAGAAKQDAFELGNSPFFAKGISYRDIVHAIERDGLLEFAGVVARSGHSTYRLAIEQETDQFRQWWSRLQDVGCTYESGECRGMRLYAVDVPPEADIYLAYAIMKEAQDNKIWLFEEGHLGHRLEGSAGPTLS
jgi:uncharacterized protein DUF4265